MNLTSGLQCGVLSPFSDGGGPEDPKGVSASLTQKYGGLR